MKVPIPPKGKYPYKNLEVGDNTEPFPGNCEKVCRAASIYAKRHGWALVTRSVGKGMLRVWRTA